MKVYHGVTKRTWGKWVTEIREPNKKSRIWLGSYPNADMAARAYDVAAHALKGEHAYLNFPDLIHLLPQPSSKLPKDIQIAAYAAAHTSINKLNGHEISNSNARSKVRICEAQPDLVSTISTERGSSESVLLSNDSDEKLHSSATNIADIYTWLTKYADQYADTLIDDNCPSTSPASASLYNYSVSSLHEDMNTLLSKCDRYSEYVSFNEGHFLHQVQQQQHLINYISSCYDYASTATGDDQDLQDVFLLWNYS